MRVVVSGRVQGVWFRESTRRCAEEAGASGWVRNLPDGRVEALFEGEASAVATALAFAREGPQLARVTRVEVHGPEPIEAMSERGFRVRL